MPKLKNRLPRLCRDSTTENEFITVSGGLLMLKRTTSGSLPLCWKVRLCRVCQCFVVVFFAPAGRNVYNRRCQPADSGSHTILAPIGLSFYTFSLAYFFYFIYSFGCLGIFADLYINRAVRQHNDHGLD